jgi:hypothetical protein
MHEKIVDVPTPDGPMETFVTHPEQNGPIATSIRKAAPTGTGN